MKKLFLLLYVPMIFSCGPSQETMDAAKIMCDCSEDLSFEDWGDLGGIPGDGAFELITLYACLGDSDDFLSYLELDSTANILLIEEKLTGKFTSVDMDRAIEKQCPKLHKKMKDVGLIYDSKY